MTTLTEHLEDYLRLRRHLGFALEAHEPRLRQFLSYLEAAGFETVTTENAVAWAGIPSPRNIAEPGLRAAGRLTAVRGFAEYLHVLDPAHQVPPRGTFARLRGRREPYIYKPEEITALLHAVRNLPGNGYGRNWSTVFGLLAATGMRIGEALRLGRADADLDAGVLTVSRNKNRHPRLVPLHPDTVEVLRDHARWRDWETPTPPGDEATFFTGPKGLALPYSAGSGAFRQASTIAGLRTSRKPEPRIHDLRHTFAVTTLLDWYRDGADVAAMMPVLSTYLGHTNPVDTYWYLSAIPELMGHAAGRLATGKTRR